MSAVSLDQESIVYGCIKDFPTEAWGSEHRRVNRQAMLSLPEAADWPYLSREMFSMPRIEISNDSFLTEVIHFGASYKAIEYEWNEWMQKFETLLDSMYWVSAIVHLETELTGAHTFTWESKKNCHTPGSGKQAIHCQWYQEKSF